MHNSHRYPTRYSLSAMNNNPSPQSSVENSPTNQLQNQLQQNRQTQNTSPDQMTTSNPASTSRPTTTSNNVNGLPKPKQINRKIEVLSSLDPKAVAEFQHTFTYTNAIGTRKLIMTKEVLDKIEGEGININDETAISKYLDDIVADDEKGNVKDGLKYLRRNLKWPKGTEKDKNKIYAYIRQAQFLKKYIKDYENDEELQQEVFHVIRRK